MPAKPKRKSIPKPVEHAVREECGQACCNPDCRIWSTATHELHHIDEDPSNSVLENLVVLCSNCHSMVGSIFSEAHIRYWKRMASSGHLPPQDGPKPKGKASPSLSMRDNYGVAGANVNIEKMTVKQERKGKSAPVPGTVGTDADMRTYADYLVKRYIEWRKKGISSGRDKRRFAPGSAHSILAEGFGSPSSVFLIQQNRFQDWFRQAQNKIDGTIWGRNNQHRNYHTWEEHLAERHG